MKLYKKFHSDFIDDHNKTYILIGYWIDLVGYYVDAEDADMEKNIYTFSKITNNFANTGVKFNKETVANFSSKFMGVLCKTNLKHHYNYIL